MTTALPQTTALRNSYAPGSQIRFPVCCGPMFVLAFVQALAPAVGDTIWPDDRFTTLPASSDHLCQGQGLFAARPCARFTPSGGHLAAGRATHHAPPTTSANAKMVITAPRGRPHPAGARLAPDTIPRSRPRGKA